MSENKDKPGCYSDTTSGNTITITTTYYPPCYEPKDPCEKCVYSKTCTKRLKTQPYPYIPPYYPWPYWYVDPNTLPFYTTCETKVNVTT